MDVIYPDFSSFQQCLPQCFCVQAEIPNLDVWITRCVDNLLEIWAQRVVVKELCSVWSLPSKAVQFPS